MITTNSKEWRRSMNTPQSPVFYLLRSDLTHPPNGRKAACSPGVTVFDELAALQGRKRSLRLTWTHLLWMLTDSSTREYVTWAQARGVLPRLSLGSANLYGVSLESANLRDANLCGASLEGANLRGADLYGAILSGANLRGADLYGANLRGANLRDANLYGASLEGANLRDANLANASRSSKDGPISGWTITNGVLARSE